MWGGAERDGYTDYRYNSPRPEITEWGHFAFRKHEQLDYENWNTPGKNKVIKTLHG